MQRNERQPVEYKVRWPKIDPAILAMAATVVLWGSNNVIIKSTVDQIEPLPYVFLRFLVVIVASFAWLRIRGELPRFPREDLKWFLLSGVTGYAIYNALFVAGLKYTTAFSIAISISLSPVLAGIIAATLNVERMRWMQWAGFLISSLGVGLFVWDKLRENNPTRGDLLGLVAAVSFAAYSLATRPIVTRHGAVVVSTWSTVIGLICVAPFALPGLLHEHWRAIGFSGWGAILYSSILSMLVGYSIWGWAIQRAGVSATVPFLYFVPVVAGIESYLFLNETFSPLKIAAALIILAGVVVARGRVWIPRRRAAAVLAASEADLASIRE